MSTTTPSRDAHAPPPTQWTATAYTNAAAFVPQLTTKVLRLLDPQPTDRVLDVGCGDAKFTSKYLAGVQEVLGVDASASFIETANQDFGEGSAWAEGLKGKNSEEAGRFRGKVVDCRFLEQDEEVRKGQWDKVVSNAALHWILRDEKTREGTLRGVYEALRPGGVFVFEMGGAGNVAEMQTAFLAALLHHTSCGVEEARRVSPWFFPDVKEMEGLLRGVGFVVGEGDLELEYRPTKMETAEDGKPNLEGWVRLMGRQFLDRAKEEGKEEEVVREVCDVVGTLGICARSDGRGEMGYVRLRGLVRRPN
jgi:SAM-dependent methyltransferase